MNNSNVAVRKQKAHFKIDIIKSFGADFDLEISDSLSFISENMNAIVYPVGHHIAIRNLFVRDDLRKNDILFIFNENDVKKITAMKSSKDNNLLLVCEKKSRTSCISVYNLIKINFNFVSILKPKRKIITSLYDEFISACFSVDGNFIASIASVTKNGVKSLYGIVWDVQVFQPFREENYKASKISIETKLLCVTGNGICDFYYIYENIIKEFKTGVKNLNTSNNFVDHDWIDAKIPTVAVLTEKNDIFILEGYYDKKEARKKPDEDEDISLRIEKFVIKQHIVNCFSSVYASATKIKAFSRGIVVGNSMGNILFLEKVVNNVENPYQVLRLITRDLKPAKVIGISFNNSLDYLAIAYNSNEVAVYHTNNLIENLRNKNYRLNFEVVCDGFHQGSITGMDVALQRPIIVTTSKTDKTIRIWNYLTGHCEYCKIILTEKDDSEKEMDILAIAIHPNGYFMAVSDKDMIRFFHLCYKEIRFYNSDAANNESPRSNCHLLKFSNGGHLLAAVSGRNIYIIRSYSRETLKVFKTNHTGTIKNVVFDEKDYFLYSIGNDGIIIEYNLFDFKMDDLSSKYINYSDGIICNFSGKPSIVACGFQSTSKHVISQIDVSAERNDSVLTQINQPALSLCHIVSRKSDINAIAFGTEEGMVNIIPYPFSNFTWDILKSHRSGITFMNFSKETNLIFSAGEDGNLFVYAVHEILDIEKIGEDNKLDNFNQLASILDEGLGDNVLYPINNILKSKQEQYELECQLAEFKKFEERLSKEYDTKLKERELEILKKKEIEIKHLNDIIKEIKISKDSTIELYENQIKNLINENNKILIEKEKTFNDRIDHLSNNIHDLNSKIHFLVNDHELELKNKDIEYEKKFKELESLLKKKFEEVNNKNEKLSEELQTTIKVDDMRIKHIDLEHEMELSSKQEKYEKLLQTINEEKLRMANEIIGLKEVIKLKENQIQERESKLKKMTEQIEQLNINLQTSKKLNEMKDQEFKELKTRLNESEKTLQEKSKLAGFSTKLKNELYKKNTEIMGEFNKQQGDINDLKTNSKNTEKELEDCMRLVENYEKEINKYKNNYNEIKKRCDLLNDFAKKKESELDDLLQKFYEVYRTNDKKKILQGLNQIYALYITPDVVRKIDSTKLNPNIRDELEKHIEFLQKSLLNITDVKSKKESIQKNEIFKRTDQNSILINELNEKKRTLTILERDYNKLKSDHSALKKTLDNVKRGEKDSKFNTALKSQFLPELNKMNENIFNNKLDSFTINNNIVPNEELYNIKNNGLTVTNFYNPNSNLTTNNFFSNPFAMSNTFTVNNGFAATNMGFMDNNLKKFNNLSKGKIHKGSIIAKNKENKETYRANELIKIIQEKDDIINKQRYELQKLQNETMIVKDNSINNDNNFSLQHVKLQNINLANLNLENQINEDSIK